MASLPNNMEHVDRRELLTSLPARIHYLHQFLEFGSDDVEALIDGQKYIKMVIPAIVNMVYKKLLKHDITARVFSNRDSRNEEDPDVWIKEESSTIQNRKMFLRWYLTKLNSDPTKFEYWEYLDKVGLMHVGQGRRNPLHVDYIFLGACLGYIQDSMMEAILYHPKLSIRRKVAIVKAVTKIIWIQNDLLARWHTTDGAEYAKQLRAEEQQQLQTETEDAEGYINGHKVLGDEVESRSSSTTTSNNSSHTTPLSTVHEDSASTHTTSTTSSGGKTSLGRSIEDVEIREMRCPFSGMAMEQRAEMTRPTLKTILDEKTMGHQVAMNGMKPSGIPKLHLVDGKTVCKEKLEREPWGMEGGGGGSVGQAL